MGQSNAGAALCNSTDAMPRYSKTKGKKRETLTLKKSSKSQTATAKQARTLIINKSTNGKRHFKPSVDFSSANPASTSASNVIPVLTAAVVPAAGECAVLDNVPVLDKTVSLPNNTLKRKNPFLPITALLLAAAIVIQVSDRISQKDTDVNVNSLNETTLDSGVDKAVTLRQAGTIESQHLLSSESSLAKSVKTADISLLQNIAALIRREQFAQDQTIDAFLNVWQSLNISSKAELNKSPWFLRFVFSLQKEARLYLQSPDSYDAKYNIKLNPLLKLSIAVGVMDQNGIQSNVELYSAKQNTLAEQLRSEIAEIEHQFSKKQVYTDKTFTAWNERFKKRLSVKPKANAVDKNKANMPVVTTISDLNASATVTAEKVDRKVMQEATVNINRTPDKEITAVELDKLVTRFTAAYEHGDLEMLVALFSPTAKTNDQINIKGIRQDYKQLFANSSFRILNIMNLSWNSANNAMKGTGDYEIAIAMGDSGNAQTLHGKIQFVIGKVDNRLRITRLYHLER